MSLAVVPEKMSRVTSGQEEDPRIARGKALKEALEERRGRGLSGNKLVAWTGLSAPTWAAAQAGKASIESYDAFEAAIAHWDRSPEDFAETVTRRAPKHAAPAVQGIEETGVVIHGLHVSDRTVDEIRVPAEFLGQPGEIARIVSEVVKGLAAGREKNGD